MSGRSRNQFIPLVLVLSAQILIAAPVIAQTVVVPSQTSAAGDTSAVAAGEPSPFDTLTFFAGLDGSKQPQDLGINANMGVRVAGNIGVPLVERWNLGAQGGVALNLSDAAVHVLDQIEGTSRRTQTFVTAGVFQQLSTRVSWTLAYDYLREHYYDDFVLGQWRGDIAYGASAQDDLGVWFTRSARGDDGVMGDTSVRLDPISQVNAYIRHAWPTGARTTLWAGVATHHHNVVVLLPDNSQDQNVLVYGAQLELPLSNRLSVTGSGNFLTPAATGTVDAYLGVTFFPGRRSPQSARPRFAPPLAVANNPEFPVDLHR
jgi:hypothetical protein